MALTQISDAIVPEVFTPYMQNITEEKARLIQSGVVVRSEVLDQLLQGGGLTFNVPSWKDLDGSVAENVSTDNVADIQAADFGAGTPATRLDATPQKTGSLREIAVRKSRNQSWSSADLTRNLAGSDPQASIASRVGMYWERRLQKMFVAAINGVIADNAAAPAGDDTHTQNDLVNDISGGSYTPGVTDFSAEALIDAAVTLGDSADDLVAVMVHSVVYARMKKNNLIDFIPDARGEVNIPTFLGHQVIVDDGMPVTSGVYDTWLFGAGAVQFGVGSAAVPTEVHRQALAGNGGGQEVLTNRVEWSLHPTGHAYVQSSIPNGGPSNANLSAAASWSRRYPERKQIKFARLVTRES